VKKDTFYLCVPDQVDKSKAVAQKIKGYSENDIGLNKIGKFWTATHIPTGRRFSPAYKTAKATLKAAKALIELSPNYEKIVQDYMSGEVYKMFSKSRSEQTTTED